MRFNGANSKVLGNLKTTQESIQASNITTSYYGNSFGYGYTEKPKSIPKTSDYLNSLKEKYKDDDDVVDAPSSKSQSQLNFPIQVPKEIVNDQGKIELRMTIKGTKDQVPRIFERIQPAQSQKEAKPQQQLIFNHTSQPNNKYNIAPSDDSRSQWSQQDAEQPLHQAKDNSSFNKLPEVNNSQQTQQQINYRLQQICLQIQKENMNGKSGQGIILTKDIKTYLFYIQQYAEGVMKQFEVEEINKTIKNLNSLIIDIVNYRTVYEQNYLNSYVKQILELAKQKLGIIKQENLDDTYVEPNKQDFMKRASEFLNNFPRKDPLRTPLVLGLYEEARNLGLQENEWDQFIMQKLNPNIDLPNNASMQQSDSNLFRQN